MNDAIVLFVTFAFYVIFAIGMTAALLAAFGPTIRRWFEGGEKDDAWWGE